VAAFEERVRRELKDFSPPCRVPTVFTVPIDEETRSAELHQFKQTSNMLPEEYYVYSLIKILLSEVFEQVDEDKADIIFLPMHVPVYSICGIDLGRSLRASGVLDSQKPKFMVYAWDTYLRPPFVRANPFCALGRELLDISDFYSGCRDWLDDTWFVGVTESTIDRHPNDFGLATIPAVFETGFEGGFPKRLLYSFCGMLNYGSVLPDSHIRGNGSAEVWHAMAASDHDDVFVGELADARETFGPQADYRDFTQNSVFTLCPAGWARWSFRLYEAIADGSIPVILSDYYALPFEGEVNWSDFSLRLPESSLPEIDAILRALTPARVELLRSGLERWKGAFSLSGLAANICRDVERQTCVD
jgi:hypothetical protein